MPIAAAAKGLRHPKGRSDAVQRSAEGALRGTGQRHTLRLTGAGPQATVAFGRGLAERLVGRQVGDCRSHAVHEANRWRRASRRARAPDGVRASRCRVARPRTAAAVAVRAAPASCGRPGLRCPATSSQRDPHRGGSGAAAARAATQRREHFVATRCCAAHVFADAPVCSRSERRPNLVGLEPLRKRVVVLAEFYGAGYEDRDEHLKRSILELLARSLHALKR
jgi:hypothetical protein